MKTTPANDATHNEDDIDPLMKKKDVAELVAKHLGYSFRHVYERLMFLPTFPKAKQIPSTFGGPSVSRWKRSDITDWLDQLKEAA